MRLASEPWGAGRRSWVEPLPPPLMAPSSCLPPRWHCLAIEQHTPGPLQTWTGGGEGVSSEEEEKGERRREVDGSREGVRGLILPPEP